MSKHLHPHLIVGLLRPDLVKPFYPLRVLCHVCFYQLSRLPGMSQKRSSEICHGYAQLSGNDFLLRNLMCTQLRTSFGNQYQPRLCWYPRRPKPPPKEVSAPEKNISTNLTKHFGRRYWMSGAAKQFQGNVGPQLSKISSKSAPEREEVWVWDP